MIEKNKFRDRLIQIDEIILFLIFLIGFVGFLTIPIILTGRYLRSGSQMFTPAMSAMLVLKIKNKNNYPRKIFDLFLFFTGLAVLFDFVDGFYHFEFIDTVQLILLCFGIVFFIVLFSEKKDTLFQYQLNFGNFKKIFLGLVFFIILRHIEILCKIFIEDGFEQLVVFVSTYSFIGYIRIFVWFIV